MDGHVSIQELMAAAGDGVGIQAEEAGQQRIAAPPELDRLQAGVETPLLLIQQAVEQQDGGLEFIGRDLESRRIGDDRDCCSGSSCQDLVAADGGIDRRVQIQARDLLSAQAALLKQVAQGVLHFSVQGVG